MTDTSITSAGAPDSEPHPEIAAIHSRLDEGDQRMARIEASLKKNTEATERVETNTSDLVDLFVSFKGAFKVLEVLGKLAKPLGAIVGLGVAVAAAWTAFRTGASPK